MRRQLLSALLLISGLMVWTAARTQPRFEVESASRFWIDGTSTMGRYTCEAGQVLGFGHVEGTRRPGVSAEIHVPVAAFDCGNPRMNRDFVNALKVSSHPLIRFRVTSAEVIEGDLEPGSWVRVRAAGTLQLAGTERPIAFTAEGQRLEAGRVRVRGSHALRMTDFGVDPPTGLLGLVRAHDRVVARFDITASAR